MKYMTGFSMLALFSISNVYAETQSAYFDIEVLTTAIDAENNKGPFPSAISDTGADYALYATKANLDQDTDIGLPYTFNQPCFYNNEKCELRFEGSENPESFSYLNAYQAWRNAMFNMDKGLIDPESYFLTETSSLGEVDGLGSDTDVKITDVYDGKEGSFYVGYGSAPYVDGEREYSRRAFMTEYSDETPVVTLLPPDFEDTSIDDLGGFTSAYKMKDVEYPDGTVKTLIVGHASQSFPNEDADYFEQCYSYGITDDTASEFDEGEVIDVDDEFWLNDLIYCPGFDTQAWAWEYDSSSTELEGFALATEWLEGNETNNSENLIYSAAALDINSSGVAVGVSTFKYSNNYYGGRQRAIIMDPSESGEYGVPTELTEATSGVSDQDDNLYNTWAVAITDDNMILGNRQYDTSKGVNYPVEFFIYDKESGDIDFPLLNKKVLSTQQRLAGTSATKSGANSHAYAMNSNGVVVGKADAYDQISPVTNGVARIQSAFLYDSNTDESWFLDDLLCTAEVTDVEDDSGNVNTVTSVSLPDPLIRLESATVINDEGIILAQGYQYTSAEDYADNKRVVGDGVTSVVVKLIINPDYESPNDSPNCWETEDLADLDTPYERSGAASAWLWLLALPLVLVRRRFI